MRSKPFLGIVVASLLIPVVGANADDLTTPKQKLSYTLGYQMGQTLKRQGVDVEPGAFAQAIEDVLSDSEPRLTAEQMRAVVAAERENAQKERAALAQKNNEAGKQFLAANKDKEGVTTLPSGLQYKVLKEGQGKTPNADNTVVVHYRGALIGGEEFDSSYKRGQPATFQLDGVIKGFQESLTQMKEGAKWQLYIPPELGYGPQGAGTSIGPNETLIFDIELLEVK